MITRDAFICENCKFNNVIAVEKNIKRRKEPHMLYVDQFTWRKFKSLAADFDSMGSFLNILLAGYNPERMVVDEVRAFD